MDEALAAVSDLVNTVDLPTDVKRTLLWCSEQLPKLYRQYLHTRESRYGAEILRLTRGMLQQLAQGQAPPAVTEGVVGLLKAAHERLGLPELDLGLPAPPPRGRKPLRAAK